MSQAISIKDIIQASAKKIKPYLVDVVTDSKVKRNDNLKKFKIYYINPHLLGKKLRPLDFDPITTASKVRNPNEFDDSKRGQIPHRLILSTHLDFKQETDDEIIARATEKISSILGSKEEYKGKSRDYDNTVLDEVNKIKDTKAFSKGIQILDKFFLTSCNKKGSSFIKLLKEHCEYTPGKDKKIKGMIQYDRKPTTEELAEIEKYMDQENMDRDDDDDSKENCLDVNFPDDMTYIVKKYFKDIEVNPKTGKIRLEFPVFRMEISVDKSNGALYLDVRDIAKRTINTKTGLYKTPKATVKNKDGKKLPVRFDTIMEFLTYGSLMTGMLVFKITIYKGGVSLNARLSHQLLALKGKSSMNKKTVRQDATDKLSSRNNLLYQGDSDSESDDDDSKHDDLETSEIKHKEKEGDGSNEEDGSDEGSYANNEGDSSDDQSD